MKYSRNGMFDDNANAIRNINIKNYLKKNNLNKIKLSTL